MSEHASEQPIIIARDVNKWYGHFHALKGINMEVKKGEVIVIFGPSGSGKSTFIRTINRLEEHQRGQIIVDGIELTHDVRNIEQVRMETGMVFQQFNLFPHLTALQNVTLAQRIVRKRDTAEAERKARELLGGHLCIKGDVNAPLLSISDKAEVEDYCRKLIDFMGRDGGFILGSGCEVPLTAKPENVAAMISAARR